MRIPRRFALPWILGLVFAFTRCSGAGTSSGGSGGGGTSGGEQNLGTADDGGTLATGDDAATTLATDAGIAPAVDSASSALVVQPGADFPIAPLHLTPTPGARNADAHVDVELRADGSIYSHGQLIGQLSGRRVLSSNGREILAVAPDGGVSVGGTPTRARMRDDGDMQMPTGVVLTFADDGTPMAIGPNQQREPGPARVLGFRPELRRTAAILTVIAATVALPPPR